MVLKSLLTEVLIEFRLVSDNSGCDIKTITLNSKETSDSALFTAIKGFQKDGHLYIMDAYKNGCRNFIIEDTSLLNDEVKSDSSIALVTNSRVAIGKISRVLYNYPDKVLNVTGVTGTKGKTTVTTLLYHIISRKINTSYFTTIRYKAGDMFGDSERTTMEADKLQYLLDKSVQSQEKAAIIEVSSHAVTLHRVEDVEWNGGIFTSFSRDHLDLYGTMEVYFQVKLDFFRALNASPKNNKFAVINIDDPKGSEVVKIINSTVELISVSTQEKNATYYIKKSTLTKTGMIISFIYKMEEITLEFINLQGHFNTVNSMLAVAAAHKSGLSFDEIKIALQDFPGVDGRFDVVVNNDPYTVIVDYAHTPDSLSGILDECRKIAKNKVLIVFGCTGDRDKEKREIMGEIASNKADYSIITNDDTYTENENQIVEMIVKGYHKSGAVEGRDYYIELDRKKAIQYALSIAQKGDVVLLAGMGHEKIQILGAVKHPHNDRDTVLHLFKK